MAGKIVGYVLFQTFKVWRLSLCAILSEEKSSASGNIVQCFSNLDLFCISCFQVQLDSLPAFGLSPRSTAWLKWIKWKQSQMRLNSSPPNVRSQREGPERCLTYSVATAILLYTNNSESTNSIYFAVYVCVCISSAYSTIWRNRHICFFSWNGIQQTYTLAIATRSSNYDFELSLVNIT